MGESTTLASGILAVLGACYVGWSLGHIYATQRAAHRGHFIAVFFMVFGMAALTRLDAPRPFQLHPAWPGLLVGIWGGLLTGRRMWRARYEEEALRTARRLTYLSDLGLCQACGSADPRRNRCDSCGQVHCAACAAKHLAGRHRFDTCLSPPMTRRVTDPVAISAPRGAARLALVVSRSGNEGAAAID